MLDFFFQKLQQHSQNHSELADVAGLLLLLAVVTQNHFDDYYDQITSKLNLIFLF